MKINDVTIKFDKGRVLLCTINKRGQISSAVKDITKDFLDVTVKATETEDGKMYIHKIGDDTYSVNTTKLNEDEIEALDVQAKKKSADTINTLSALSRLANPYVSMFGYINDITREINQTDVTRKTNTYKNAYKK